MSCKFALELLGNDVENIVASPGNAFAIEMGWWPGCTWVSFELHALGFPAF